MKQILLLTMLTLLCSADMKQEIQIKGQWQWVKSEFIARGMSQPKVSTPKSRKYEVILDIREKEIEIIKNGDSVAVVPYLYYQQTEDLKVLRVSIPQDDFPFFISSGPVYFKADTMIIGGTYNDAGEDQYYIRIQENN